MATRGINKVILIGNLGQDIELRHTQSGTAVAQISLATGEAWKDQNGQLQERTEWHRLVAYGRTAENAGKYLGKGSKIYVEGRLQTRKWQDKTGADRYTTEIVINELQYLDRADSTQAAPAPAGASYNPAAPRSEYNTPLPEEDDIPF